MLQNNKSASHNFNHAFSMQFIDDSCGGFAGNACHVGYFLMSEPDVQQRYIWIEQEVKLPQFI
jgi:hypothetical protein